MHVIEDSVIVLCPEPTALLYIKKSKWVLQTGLYWVAWKSGLKKRLCLTSSRIITASMETHRHQMEGTHYFNKHWRASAYFDCHGENNCTMCLHDVTYLVAWNNAKTFQL